MTLEELNQHLALREQWEHAQTILAALYDAAIPGAAKITGMPHAPGVNDKVGDLAAEIADMRARIGYLEEQIVAQEPVIAAWIAGIDNDQARIALRLRFLRGLSWKEVSAILGKYTSEASIKATCYRYIFEDDGM